MEDYEILPHTADVRLKVRGETLEELFKQAVLGMAQILKNNAPALPRGRNTANINTNDAKKEEIKVSSNNITTLLIDFLNEILLKSQINKQIYNVSSFNLHDLSLMAEIRGFLVDSFDEDIKAVTYHEAEIKKNEKGDFETIIIFDI